MKVTKAIRGRRTHKAYGREPVPREILEELFELARWAPNHHLTNPWRFRVLGPKALERLKRAAGGDSAGKLDRAPTLVVASVTQSGKEVDDLEDLCAAAAATYILLLAAHERGLASYWRTPGVLRTKAGRRALRIPADEVVLGLIHLGEPRQKRPVPARAPTADVVTYLD